jgi:hypothetical protein
VKRWTLLFTLTLLASNAFAQDDNENEYVFTLILGNDLEINQILEDLQEAMNERGLSLVSTELLPAVCKGLPAGTLQDNRESGDISDVWQRFRDSLNAIGLANIAFGLDGRRVPTPTINGDNGETDDTAVGLELYQPADPISDFLSFINQNGEVNVTDEGTTIAVLDYFPGGQFHGEAVVDIVSRVAPQADIFRFPVVNPVKEFPAKLIIQGMCEAVEFEMDNGSEGLVINLSASANITNIDYTPANDDWSTSVLFQAMQFILNIQTPRTLIVTSIGNDSSCDANNDDGSHILAMFNGDRSNSDALIPVASVKEIGSGYSWDECSPTAPYIDVAALGVNPFDVSNSGTSFAAPWVSGTVALMLEASQFSKTSQEIEQCLKNTASQASSPDDFIGFGMINVNDAVACIQP